MNIEQGILNVEFLDIPTSKFDIQDSIFNITFLTDSILNPKC